LFTEIVNATVIGPEGSPGLQFTEAMSYLNYHLALHVTNLHPDSRVFLGPIDQNCSEIFVVVHAANAVRVEFTSPPVTLVETA
jgi:hypothetical protein